MAVILHFYELPVYKVCRNFRKEVSKVVRTFPREEKFLLGSQVLDSSRSVTANLAEGFGRFHYQENIQFCRQARGSLTETMDHMIAAFDEDYIDDQKLVQLNSLYKDCLKEINSYIKYLKNRKTNN